jgi:hypothetical protein
LHIHLLNVEAPCRDLVVHVLVAGVEAAVVAALAQARHLLLHRLNRLLHHTRKGTPDTFDAAGYVNLLTRIKAQRPGDDVVYAPEFRRETEEALAWMAHTDGPNARRIAQSRPHADLCMAWG